LERWQSLRDWRAKYVISESGVEPLELSDFHVNVKFEYGHTKGSPKLRELIASRLGRGSEEVIITNGGAEANYLASLALIKPGDEVIVDMPNYMQIPGILRGIGANVVYIWRKEGMIDLDELNQLVNRKTKALVITNPNNPTGMAMSEREMKAISDIASDRGVTLIVDEVYRGSEFDGEKPSFLSFIDGVSTNSMSKVYGLPGIRIGWTVAKKELVDRMWAIRDYVNISPSVIGQEIAYEALLKADELKERSREIVSRNLKIVEEVMRREEVDHLVEWHRPNATALAFLKLKGVKDTFSFAQSLFQNEGVLLNPGECFEMPGYVRIGIGQGDKETLRTALTLTFRHMKSWSLKT